MAGSQSLERGLEILELLDKSPKAIGVREISRMLDLSPPIVQRLINTLSEFNYVWQDPETRRYRIGYRALGLGWNITMKEQLISVAKSELEKLASEHLLNSYMGVLSNDQAVYVLSVQSEGPITIRTIPGSVAQLHSTAMGKALLSGMSDDAARRLLAVNPLKSLTPLTKTDPEQLIVELAEIRKRGYAIAKGENISGVTSVGAPIFGASGKMLAAISCAFPELSTSTFSEESVSGLVLASAARISQALGFEGSGLSRELA